MNSINRTALFMQEHHLTLATAESCTAGLIAATLAEVPGAGQLLDCAFVVYSPEAKHRCLGVAMTTLAKYNLTSEAVAREMALGAARLSPANIAIANTGVADDVDDDVPRGTQCFAWVFKSGPADGHPGIYSETRRFDGGRHAVRKAAAEFALHRMVEKYQTWRTGKSAK
jgi:nicotinamide-nucleotide amidase